MQRWYLYLFLISPFLSWGQTSLSRIHWPELDPINWMNYERWKQEGGQELPYWQKRVLSPHHREKMAWVLACSGRCYGHDGKRRFVLNPLMSLREREMVTTGEKSYLWLLLAEGTLVRIAPQSSLSLLEINLGRQNHFVAAKLNYGHLFWFSRTAENLKTYARSETDVLPLREIIKTCKRHSYTLRDMQGFCEQRNPPQKTYEQVNAYIQANNQKIILRETYSFLLVPNGSFYGKNMRMQIVYGLGDQLFFKNRLAALYYQHPEKFADDGSYFYRAKTFKELPLTEGRWWQVNREGTQLTAVKKEKHLLLGDLLLERFPTILLMRESLIKTFMRPYLAESSAKNLSLRHHYHLWEVLSFQGEKDLQARWNYLKKQSYFLESFNLLTLKMYRQKNPQKFTQTLWLADDYQLSGLIAYFDHLYTQGSYAEEIEMSNFLPLEDEEILYEYFYKFLKVQDEKINSRKSKS